METLSANVVTFRVRHCRGESGIRTEMKIDCQELELEL